MVRPIIIKCDPEFHQLARKLKGEFQNIYGERVSDRLLTKHIARFMQEEKLDEIMRRRAAYRHQRGGGFF